MTGQVVSPLWSYKQMLSEFCRKVLIYKDLSFYDTHTTSSASTIKVALPARVELATCGLGNRRSIHLSYGSAMTCVNQLDLNGILMCRKNQDAMTSAKIKTKQWPPIHEVHYGSGKAGWQVACQVNEGWPR